MASSSRKRNPDQYCHDNEQEQDQDECRNRSNSYGLLHDYPSQHVNRRLGYVQTSINNCVVVVAESSSNHQFLSNGINHKQVQEGSPIRLNLMIDESLIKKIELALTQEKQENSHQESLSQSQPQQKLKASNMHAVSLKIGSWIWASRNEGDLMIKFYYGKKKLVWEFLFGSKKKKIETRWSNVSAIRAYVDQDKNGCLEIELEAPPQYYEEAKIERFKHTQWQTTTDFTQDQAERCRRHAILFLPGVLDEPIKKLLQYDNRLFNLSRQPFPVHNSQFFNKNMEFSYDVRVSCPPVSLPNYDHQGTVVPSVQNPVQPTSSFVGQYSGSNLPMPGVTFPNLDENAKEASYVNERTDGVLKQSGNNHIQDLPLPPIKEQDDYVKELEAFISDHELELPDLDDPNLPEILTTIENCFKGDSTFEPFQPNHQYDSNPPGNEINDYGNHHVGRSHIDPDLACMERITSSSGCGPNYTAYADDDVSNFARLQFNDVPEIQELDSWLSPQLNMHGSNNGGNGELPLQGSNSGGAGSSS